MARIAHRIIIVETPMVDVDAVQLRTDPGLMTTLAVALECAMLMDDAARARYAAIYGREWQSLADIESETANTNTADIECALVAPCAASESAIHTGNRAAPSSCTEAA